MLVTLSARAASAQMGQLDRVDRDADNRPIVIELSGSFLQDIERLYPESSPQAALAPEGPSLLVTRDNATVTLAFVSEVALLRNLVGYFVYTVDAAQQVTITDRQLIFPNAAMSDPTVSWGEVGGYGELHTGQQATLRNGDGSIRRFAAGTRIGFFVIADGWRTAPATGGPDQGASEPFVWSAAAARPSTDPQQNSDESSGLYVFTTVDQLNPEHPAYGSAKSRHFRAFRHEPLANWLPEQPLYIFGLEDVARADGMSSPRFEARFYTDDDFNDMVFLVSGQVEVVTEPEGDGNCPGDAFPDDPLRCYLTRTQGTLAFEDNYPEIGDMDYNDVVVSYDAQEIRNAANEVTDLILTYNLYARGALYDHDFGVAIDNVPADTTGSMEVEYYPSFIDEPVSMPLSYGASAQIQGYVVPTPDPNDGADVASIRLRHLIPSTLHAFMQSVCGWSQSTFNTEPTGNRCRSAAVRVSLHFDRPIADAMIAQAPYDPFLELGGPLDSGTITPPRDVHLPGFYSFTAMQGTSSSITGARPEDVDPSNPARFTVQVGDPNGTEAYRLPWVLHIPDRLMWRYPQDSHSVGTLVTSVALPPGTMLLGLNAYPQFDAWIKSAGESNTSWYEDPDLSQVIVDPEQHYFSDFPWGTWRSGGSNPGPDPSPGPSPPPVALPFAPAVARGAVYFNTTERFNRYYTERDWQPLRTVYVSVDGTGDGSSRERPTSAGAALSAVTPGTKVVFLPGIYNACWELSDHEGTYDAPIVLYAERNADGSRGVHMNCCGSGRQTCINLEGASYVAIDGFEMQGGRYGARAVGLDYYASAHTRGTAVLNCHIYAQLQDPILTGAADWAVFENNLTHDAGTGDGHGIYLSNGSDWNIVRFNETYRNARSDFQVNADPLSTCDDYFSPACDAQAGQGEGGAGASDFFLIEGNYFHHGNGPGPNFTSMRYSVLRNNIFGIYARHGTSFWQETDNPNLGSHDNQVLHNLLIGTNTNHTLQFINNSGRNTVSNNLILGVSIVGTTVVANPAVVGMEVDATVSSNSYQGNFYLAAWLDGRTAGDSETVLGTFDPAWLVRFPVAIDTAADLHPTPLAPWLDKGALLSDAPFDRDGVMRADPADIGPYELR